jgi:hypothetical protein
LLIKTSCECFFFIFKFIFFTNPKIQFNKIFKRKYHNAYVSSFKSLHRFLISISRLYEVWKTYFLYSRAKTRNTIFFFIHTLAKKIKTCIFFIFNFHVYLIIIFIYLYPQTQFTNLRQLYFGDTMLVHDLIHPGRLASIESILNLHNDHN